MRPASSVLTRLLLPAALAFALHLSTSSALADFTVTGAFGPNGDLGFATSPANLGVTFGTGQGSISQLDAFVNVAGKDFSTNGFGTSRDLAESAPAGLAFSFLAAVPTPHQLLLTYHFVNNTGAALPGFQFMGYVDADIGPNFTDETVATAGALGGGPPGTTPVRFQASDPSFGTIFTNLAAGTLNNVNDLPAGSPGDGSIAIGLLAGLVPVGGVVEFQVLLSDDGSALPGRSLTQSDPVFARDTLTVSARASLLPPVPEPSSIALLVVGLIGLSARFFRRMSRVG